MSAPRTTSATRPAPGQPALGQPAGQPAPRQNVAARWFASRGVRAKILLIVAVLGVVAGGVGLLSAERLGAVERAGDGVYQHAMTPSLQLLDVKTLMLSERDTAQRHETASTPEAKRHYEGVFREQSAHLDSVLAHLAAARGPGDAARVARLRGSVATYQRIVVDEYLPASSRGDQAGISEARDKASPVLDQGLATLNGLIAGQQAYAGAVRRQLAASYRSSLVVLAVALLLGLALGLGLALHVARLIVRPLLRVEWVAAGLMGGDLDRATGVRSGDEVGRMARALDQAVATRLRLEGELRERTVELDRVSTTDVLTELRNRRSMEEHLFEAWSLASRHHEELSVLLLDLDQFKRINDCHGHEAGDAVLREVAERMRIITRLEDVAGRWGGEEFLVLLPRTGPAGAMVLAKRLRVEIGGRPIALPSGKAVTVTVSIGVASGTAGGRQELLRRVDDARYAAKADGRDRVVAAPGGCVDSDVPDGVPGDIPDVAELTGGLG